MANEHATPTAAPAGAPTAPANDGGLQWTPIQQTAPAQTSPTAAPSNDGGLKWTPINAPGFDEQTDTSFGSDAFAKHPVLTKWHKGIEEGMQDGLGLKAPDPNNPHSLGISDVASQTWNNLKRAAIHSYENLGGSVPNEVADAVVPGGSLALKTAAALGTPFDMIGTGINSMAHSLEDGYKEYYRGTTAGDHEQAAHGVGKMLASLGQIAMGMEKGAAGEIANKATQSAGEVASKRALVPGRSLLGATRRTSSLYGKDVGKVFTEEPIRPTFSIENLQNQIVDIQHDVAQQVRNELGDPAVNKPSINTHQVIDDAVNEELQALTKESGLKNRPAVIDAIKKLRDDVVNQHDADGNVVGSLKNQMQTPLEADAVKRSIGKNTRWEADPELEQYANSARKRMYGKLNDAIEGQVGKAKPGTSIKGLNARYANLIEAERLIRERLRKESASDNSLSEMLKRGEFYGGIVSLLGGLEHANSLTGLGATLGGAGMLADRAMRSTPGRIVRAKAGAVTGQALQSAAKAGVPGTVVQGATAASADKWIHVQLSDGKEWEVHPEDFPKLMQRDPKLRVILTPGSDEE